MEQQEEERSYLYGARTEGLVAGTLFFGVGTIVSACIAATNDKGVVIEGIIKLGVNGATIFYWILTAMSAAIVSFVLYAAFRKSTNPRHLVVSHDCIKVPGPVWSDYNRTILVEDIQRVSVIQRRHSRTLRIHSSSAQSVDIQDILLPQNSDLDEIRTAVSHGASSAQQRHEPQTELGTMA